METADAGLLAALQTAVGLEMLMVTDASTALAVADRDAWIYHLDRSQRFLAERRAMFEVAEGDRGGEWAARRDTLTCAAQEEYEKAQRTDMGMIAFSSDQLLYGGKECKTVFAAATRVIAHLAFAPGGITLFGLHWCRHGHYGIPQGKREFCAISLREDGGDDG